MRLLSSFCLLFVLILSGCSNHYSEINTSEMADRLNRVDYSIEPKTAPRPAEIGYLNMLKRKSNLIDEVDINYDKNSIVGKALDRHMKYVRAYDNTELFSFIALLFANTGVVIKYGPDVDKTKPVTVDFRASQTVKDILDSALTSLDYRYRILDDKTIEIIAYETLEVYLRMPNSQFSYNIEITNGSFKNEDGETENAPTGTNINFSTTSADTANSQGGEGGSAVVSFWRDLNKSLKSLVSKKGSISVSSSTGTLIITDTPSRINKIAKYLQGVADDLGKQVLIEVNVMEVSFAESNAKGIQWEQVFDSLGRSTVGGIKYVPTSFVDENKSMIEFTLLNSSDNYKMLIQALREQGKLSIISKPKVLALNHQPVIIQGGQFITYVKRVETTSQSDSGSINYSAEPGSLLNGLTLFIHPSISENEVTLNLTPVVSRVTDMKTVTFGDTLTSNGIMMQLPTVSVQTMNTSAKVQNGEVLVLGGLLTDSKEDKQSGLPFVNRIPVIGKAFSWLTDTTLNSVERREIVITLMPRILSEPAAYLEIRRI